MTLIDPKGEHRKPKHLGEPRDATFILAALVPAAVMVLIAVWSVSFPPAPVTVVPLASTTSTTSTSTTLEPATTTTTAAPAPPVRWTTASTEYCEHGATASGVITHDGVVAVSFGRYPTLLGTSWRVLDGSLAGKVLTVADKGPSAEFDVWVPSCATATAYGLHTITVEKVERG